MQFRWSSQSIVTRLTTWYAASLFIILLGATGFLYFSLFKILSAEENTILRDRTEAIFTLINNNQSLSALKQRVELEWASRRFEHVYVKIVTKKEDVVIASPQIPTQLESEVFSSALNSKLLNLSSPHRFTLKDGHAYLVISTEANLPVKPDSLLPSMVIVALDLSVEKEILEQYRSILIFVLLISFLVATGVGIRLARLSFMPVQQIIDKARKIRSSSLHERISEKGLPTELKTLAQTVNEMLDRLEESFGRLSRFSADIAHELRTPISNIQGEIQVSFNQERSLQEHQELILSVHEEVIRISKLIDSLLFLAKSENPEVILKKEMMSLKAEIENIFDFYEASATEEGIEMSVDIPENIAIQVERSLFQRAIGNLISNSINYTAKGAKIRVTGVQTQDGITITVEDSGQGIPNEQLAMVFERFYRVDPSRTATKLGGFGLGLTIVKSIMQLHHGTVSITSQVGIGTKVTLKFPHGELVESSKLAKRSSALESRAKGPA